MSELQGRDHFESAQKQRAGGLELGGPARFVQDVSKILCLRTLCGNHSTTIFWALSSKNVIEVNKYCVLVHSINLC
jgi:hypothetical protein